MFALTYVEKLYRKTSKVVYCRSALKRHFVKESSVLRFKNKKETIKDETEFRDKNVISLRKHKQNVRCDAVKKSCKGMKYTITVRLYGQLRG